MSDVGKAIKVAIADDEALIVLLLSDYLTKQKGMQVLFTANDGNQIVDRFAEADVLPDILLLDLQMGETNGIDAAAVLKQKYHDLKIVVVSSHYKKMFMGYMFKLGVNAFLPKGIAPDILADAVEAVYTQGYFFMEEQIEVMRSQIATTAPAPVFSTEEALTDREVEILQLICKQFTAQQIADKLFITKRTVEGHKSNLLLKTSAKNTAGLVIYAIQKQIINIDDCFFSLSDT